MGEGERKGFFGGFPSFGGAPGEEEEEEGVRLPGRPAEERSRERERRPAWRNRTKVCQSILSLSFSLSFLPEEISPFSSSLRAKKFTNHQGTEERTREKFSRRSPSRELFSRVCTMSWRPRPGPPSADKVARRASLFALHTIFAEQSAPHCC